MNTAAVAEAWFTLTLQTYPPETARLLRRQGDPFGNPMGHALRQGMIGIVECLDRMAEPEEYVGHLAEIIKLRAVQAAPPSRALRLFPLLKAAARTTVGTDLPEGFDARIDDLALLAFDLYTECRERLYELRAQEARNRTFRLLQRAGYLADDAAATYPGGGCSCGPSCSSCDGCDTEE